MWENDMKHGKGIQSWENGSEFEGIFVKNQKHGKGKYTKPNKDFDYGPWINDLRHGEFIFVINGKKNTVFYDKGKFAKK